MGASSRMVATIIEVADLDRSVALYRDGFGVDLHRSDHESGDHDDHDRWISGPHAATSWTDGGYIHFAVYQSKGERTSHAQLAFQVADIAAAHAAAVAAGAEVIHDPRVEPWGTSARYRDPDGNVIELTQHPER